MAIDDDPVGFVSFERKPDRYLQIWNIVVTTKRRRQGVGRRLVEEVMKISDSILFNVRESNTDAHLFLKRLNFWCYAKATNYFIDKIRNTVTKEDAYCFDYNPQAQRKPELTLRTTRAFTIRP